MNCQSLLLPINNVIGSFSESCQALFYLKMAARARKERGFYASLNSISSIDMLPETRKRKTKGRGRLWEVERLIAKRESATVS